MHEENGQIVLLQNETDSDFPAANSSSADGSYDIKTRDDEWIIAVKIWISFLTIFGGVGNFLTMATIFHQMILHKRSKRMVITNNARNSFLNGRKISSQWFTYHVDASHSITSTSFIKSEAKTASLRSPKSPGITNSRHAKKINRNPIMKIQADTILLAHLIFCDFLYCVISLPHTLYVYGFKDYPGQTPVLCEFAAFFRYVNAFAEWTTLGLLTVQRCIDLTKPPNARFFRTKSTLVSIAGIWIMSIFIQLGNISNGRYGYDKERYKCNILGSKSSMIFFFMIDSILPCGLMLFGCLSIIFQIIRNKRRLQRLGVSPNVVVSRAKKMWKSAALMLGLLSIFSICVIPLCIYNVLFVWGISKSLKWEIIVYMIYWCEYGINFVIYAARKRQYRRAYRDLFFAMFPLQKLFPRESLVCSSADHANEQFANGKQLGEKSLKDVQSVVIFKDRKKGILSSSRSVDSMTVPTDSPPDLLIGHKV